jgi:hypothetical protein
VPSPTVLADGVTKVYLDAPYVSVRWEAQGQWVVAEWKGWANSSEFRAAQETTLQAIQENQAVRLLLDMRLQKLVLVEDERWVRESLLPRFAIAGIRWGALVVPVNNLAAAILAEITKTPPAGEGQRKQFADIDEAKRWLLSMGDRTGQAA